MSILGLAWYWFFLLLFYTAYSLIRAFWIYGAGYKEAIIGDNDDIKLYHLLWGLLDIPALIFSSIFPLFKLLFNIPVIPLKKDKKKKW